MLVSYYQSITNTKSQEQQDLLAVLNNIKSGVYEDYVHPVRTAKTDEQKKKAKLNAPCITTSGVFSQRGNNYLKKHSGFIAIDFDHLQDIGDAFNLLINDEYTFALFTSISGNGLCCIVKIDGKKHLEAFQALDKYYSNRDLARYHGGIAQSVLTKKYEWKHILDALNQKLVTLTA